MCWSIIILLHESLKYNLLICKFCILIAFRKIFTLPNTHAQIGMKLPYAYSHLIMVDRKISYLQSCCQVYRCDMFIVYKQRSCFSSQYSVWSNPVDLFCWYFMLSLTKKICSKHMYYLKFRCWSTIADNNLKSNWKMSEW